MSKAYAGEMTQSKIIIENNIPETKKNYLGEATLGIVSAVIIAIVIKKFVNKS